MACGHRPTIILSILRFALPLLNVENLPMSVYLYLKAGPVARSDAWPPGIQKVANSILRTPAKHSFVETGNEIISMAILSLPLIKVKQLSVTGKVLVNCLGLSLPRKSVVRLMDCLDMPIAVDLVCKTKNQDLNLTSYCRLWKPYVFIWNNISF